jgi:hypothetical protein
MNPLAPILHLHSRVARAALLYSKTRRKQFVEGEAFPLA